MPQLLSEILIDDGRESCQKSFSVPGAVTGVNGESLLPVGEGALRHALEKNFFDRVLAVTIQLFPYEAGEFFQGIGFSEQWDSFLQVQLIKAVGA